MDTSRNTNILNHFKWITCFTIIIVILTTKELLLSSQSRILIKERNATISDTPLLLGYIDQTNETNQPNHTRTYIFERFSVVFKSDHFLEIYGRLCDKTPVNVTDNINLPICSCIPDILSKYVTFLNY